LTSEELIRRGEKITADSKAIEFRGLVGASLYATNHIDTVATTEVIGCKSTPGETAAQQHTSDDWIMKAVDRRKCGVKLVGTKSFYIHFTGKEALDRVEFTAKVEMPVLMMLSRHMKLMPWMKCLVDTAVNKNGAKRGVGASCAQNKKGRRGGERAQNTFMEAQAKRHFWI